MRREENWRKETPLRARPTRIHKLNAHITPGPGFQLSNHSGQHAL